MSNSHGFASKQFNISMAIVKIRQLFSILKSFLTSHCRIFANSEGRIINLEQKKFICAFKIKQEVSVTGMQTLENLNRMKEVDSQHTPLVKVYFSPVDS